MISISHKDDLSAHAYKGSVSVSRKGSMARCRPRDIEVFLRCKSLMQRGCLLRRLVIKPTKYMISVGATPQFIMSLASLLIYAATSLDGRVGDRNERSSRRSKRALLSESIPKIERTSSGRSSPLSTYYGKSSAYSLW